jgi:hypothetical protein
MSIARVHSALVLAYQEMGLALPTGYETRDFTPPASGAWADIVNIPASLDPLTLGNEGEDLYIGVFQIDIHVPENTGTGMLLDYADVIRSYFYVGRTLLYNGQRVRIRKTQPSPIRRAEGGGRYTISLSVTWNAWLSRKLETL